MSDDIGTKQGSDAETEHPAGELEGQVVGDDESSYGGAAANDEENGQEPRPGSGQNRPPSEQDEDQGI